MRQHPRAAAFVLASALLVLGACRSTPGKTTAEADPASGSGAPSGESATPAAGREFPRAFVNLGLKRGIAPLIAAFANEFPDLPIKIEYLSSKEITERVAAGDIPDLVIDNTRRLPAIADHRLEGTTDVPLGVDFIEITVPAGNPKGITDLTPFGADPATVSALCAPEEPCGASGAAIVTGQGITASVDKIGDDADTVVANLVEGRADVALLYRSDAHILGAGKLQGLPVPGEERAAAAFHLMVLKGSLAAKELAMFVNTDPTADTALTSTGFRPL